MKFKCKKCKATNTISDKKIARHLASKGGSVTGKSKARDPKKMRAAALRMHELRRLKAKGN